MDNLILGKIHVTENKVTVVMHMINGITNKVVLKEELTESLSNYSSISTFFTQSVVHPLNENIPKLIVEKLKLETKNKVKPFITFSSAVNYLDQSDRQGAKAELIREAELDPESKIIKFYLQKMEWSIDIVSPRFRISPELYTSTYNPASLAFINQDKFYMWMPFIIAPPNEIDDHGSSQLVDEYYVTDKISSQRFGYIMPLGKKMGLGLEFTGGGYDRMPVTPYPFDYNGSTKFEIGGSPRSNGGTVSLGYSFLDNMSLGASLRVWYLNIGTEPWKII